MQTKPVYLVRLQTIAEDVDKILDAITQAAPLSYGKYARNAFVTAEGQEIYTPLAGSTNDVHQGKVDQVVTLPAVELTFTIARDEELLEKVLHIIHEHHHYEEPVVHITEGLVSRADYDPHRNNPNRWYQRSAAKA